MGLVTGLLIFNKELTITLALTIAKIFPYGAISFILIIAGLAQLHIIVNQRISSSVFTLAFGQTDTDGKNNSMSVNASSINTVTFPQQTHVSIVVGAALKRDKAFQPNPVGVTKNGTVTWMNEDTVTHTVTSGNGTADPNMGKTFDSGLLGKTFSFMFSKPGVYNYFCQVHPTMVGKIIVK